MNLLTIACLLVTAQNLVRPWALLERAEAALRIEGEALPLLCGTVFLKSQSGAESMIADLSDDGSHGPFFPAPGWGIHMDAAKKIGKRRGDAMLSLAEEIAAALPRLPAPAPAWARPRSQAMGYPDRPMPTPAAFFSREKEQAHA